VRDALESLPWVEKGSVQADVSTHLASFVVTDKEKFDQKAVAKVLEEAGYDLDKVVSGLDPKEKRSSNPSDTEDTEETKREEK
jgi:division protein CdvB (Snf7/Vps24/ESCRT-III family)